MFRYQSIGFLWEIGPNNGNIILAEDLCAFWVLFEESRWSYDGVQWVNDHSRQL